MVLATTVLEEARSSTYKLAHPTRHIDALRPLPDNPREDIDENDPKIQDMAQSIIKHNIIEPLVINPDNYIYAGHRRRVASRVAYKLTGDEKFLYVPVTINNTPLEAALELVLQENMQRASLNLLEEARAMRGIMERKQFKVADLAREIAIPASEISPRLAILKCEEPVQRLFAQDQLPLSSAVWLAYCEVPEQQINYAGLLARRQITIEQLKATVRDESFKARHKKPEPVSTRGSESKAASSERPRASRAQQPDRGSSASVKPLPTREEAMATLQRAITSGKRSITLHNFKTTVESICCACGMVGDTEVCRSCPFARIIIGVTGRAD